VTLAEHRDEGLRLKIVLGREGGTALSSNGSQPAFRQVRSQSSNTGQYRLSHRVRPSILLPLQMSSTPSAQNRQIACWTERWKKAGNAGLKSRASIRRAKASMIAAQPLGA
jgi:hypothetical protein